MNLSQGNNSEPKPEKWQSVRNGANGLIESPLPVQLDDRRRVKVPGREVNGTEARWIRKAKGKVVGS